MKIQNELIINSDIIMVYPEFDQNGNVSTIAMGGKGPIKVNKSPSEFMDHTLKYYGSSLRGALDGSRTILGRIRMHPIVVNERLGLYWFSSKSHKREDCVWFALHHIKEHHAIDKKNTKVLFSNGDTLDIEMSYASFEKKVQHAYKLQGKMENRARETSSQVAESKAKYHLNMGIGEINYEIRED